MGNITLSYKLDCFGGLRFVACLLSFTKSFALRLCHRNKGTRNIEMGTEPRNLSCVPQFKSSH